MATFPGAKVHRTSRRKLGRGQAVLVPPTAAVLTGSVDTVTITFSAPMICTGPVGLTVATLTIVSQTIVSPTVITVLMNGAVATHLGTLPANDPHLRNFQGGSNALATATF